MDDEQMKGFARKFKWIFAKTYAEICPHEYIVKTKIDNSYWKEFEAVVEYIRHAGFEASYNQRVGKYYVLDENYYWTMGAPISDTIIINRAKLSDYHLEGDNWIWNSRSDMLTKAIEIALKAHDGQFDKGRHPYILHPLRVMLSFDNEVEQICAVLHDVLEDSPMTISELRMAGLSETILEVLDCLTKRQDEEKDYDKFIDRLLSNELACRVKLADLEDNMDLSRICVPSSKDQDRFLKYQAAYAKIRTHLGI